jgi:hypothetical protein
MKQLIYRPMEPAPGHRKSRSVGNQTLGLGLSPIGTLRTGEYLMMDPVEEFRRHAAECQRMARQTVNAENSATWNRMAERWLRCAERVQPRPARRVPRYRQSERPIYRNAS